MSINPTRSLFQLLVVACCLPWLTYTPAHAGIRGGCTSLDRSLQTLTSPADYTTQDLVDAGACLQAAVIQNPAILSEMDDRIIRAYPELFNKRVLDRLFAFLQDDTTDRPASKAIVHLLVAAADLTLQQSIVARLNQALSTSATAWRAAEMTSMVAKQRPQALDQLIIDRLWQNLNDPFTRIISAYALGTLAIHTPDQTITSVTLDRAFTLLMRQKNAEAAAYIIFKLAESRSSFFKDKHINQLFDYLYQNDAVEDHAVSLALLAQRRDRNAYWYVTDALAAIAVSGSSQFVARDIIAKAFEAFHNPPTAKPAALILQKTAETIPFLIDAKRVSGLFDLIAYPEQASYAAEVLAAYVAHTSDEDLARLIVTRALPLLTDRDTIPYAITIISGIEAGRQSLIDDHVVSLLLSVLDNDGTGLASASALSDMAVFVDHDVIAQAIISAALLHLRPSAPPKQAARIIRTMANQRPLQLRPHINELLHFLVKPAVRREIGQSLYYALLANDPFIAADITAYIEAQLALMQLGPAVHESLLAWGQTISFDLDRQHNIDITNRRMRRTIAKLPDHLLYLLLAQGVEGYITTFKEIHRAFKQRKLQRNFKIDETNGNDRLWPLFKAIDRHGHFTSELLFAYSAKGHLAYIIPGTEGARQDMIDTALDLILRIENVDQIKTQGTLMAGAMGLFVSDPRMRAYASQRLVQVYRENIDHLGSRVMLEALIFKNRTFLERYLRADEKAAILHSGHYIDYALIPNSLNARSQKIFYYFDNSQKGYLSRIVDYYLGRPQLFSGDGFLAHPHLDTIKGYRIDAARSTVGVSDGFSADRAMGNNNKIRVVLFKTLPNGNHVEYEISNSIDWLEQALIDTRFDAYGFAGHSSESWRFRDLVAEHLGDSDRPIWIYEGSCGSARQLPRIVQNLKIYLFSNLETGQGAINQIQVYYIAKYLAEGRFATWPQLKEQMEKAHSDYTSKLYYPGSPADDVLKNYLYNIKRLSGG